MTRKRGSKKRKGRRNDVDYMEFRDGYVLVEPETVLDVIDGYRRRVLRRNELRVFAATLEKTALHGDSKVDLYRIVNCKSGMKGIRRLTTAQIERARGDVDLLINSSTMERTGRQIAISRKMLRHAAKGGATCNEMIVMLFYCVRRMRQHRRLERLHDHERYARFTYRDLSRISGIPKANLSRAVARLRHKGVINTVYVKKQNENQFGLLFVDGRIISLSYPTQPLRRHERPSGEGDASTTPVARIDNTPDEVSTTLRNNNPKTWIPTQRRPFTANRNAKSGKDWERILIRAAQMRDEFDLAAGKGVS